MGKGFGFDLTFFFDCVHVDSETKSLSAVIFNEMRYAFRWKGRLTGSSHLLQVLVNRGRFGLLQGISDKWRMIDESC